jgi:hypothetical protein
MDSQDTAGASAESEATSSRYPGAALFVTIGVVIVFLLLLLNATQGHFVPQVADLYIVLQYAQAMAEGHPFQYNAGEAATTGSTSLLHTSLLALAYAFGAQGEALVAFAILFGALLLGASVVLAYRVGRVLAGEREGQLSALLVALGGPVVWGFLYGSDIALFMFLALWLLERLIVEWNEPRMPGSLAVASLLALARPEGLPIAIGLGLAWTLRRAQPRSLVSRVSVWTPTLCGLSVLVLYKWMTGSWLGTSISGRGLAGSYGWPASVALSADYITDVLRGILLGFFPSAIPIGFHRGWAPYYFPPFALVFIFVAVWSAPTLRQLPLRAWCVLAAGVCVFITPSIFMGVHFNRYILWTFPPLLVLCAVGIGRTSAWLARGDTDLDWRVFRAAAAVAILFGALATARVAVFYGNSGGKVWLRDVATANWIRKNLPHGVTIANTSTAIEFLTGHRNMNLHGVTSPFFLDGYMAEREANILEVLGRLPPEARPEFLVSSVGTHESQVGIRALARGEPLYRSMSLGDELLVFPTKWDVIGANHRMYDPLAISTVAGLEEVDRLNVCDPADEASHGYRVVSRLGHMRLHGAPHAGTKPDGAGSLLDAGRVVLGQENFEIRARPGKNMILVLRTADAAEANVYTTEGSRRTTLALGQPWIDIRCDGVALPRVSFRPELGWNEITVVIPGERIRQDRLRLELRGHYAAYYYWFYQ